VSQVRGLGIGFPFVKQASEPQEAWLLGDDPVRTRDFP